jgi:hypothetical protein
MSEIEDLEK